MRINPPPRSFICQNETLFMEVVQKVLQRLAFAVAHKANPTTTTTIDYVVHAARKELDEEIALLVTRLANGTYSPLQVYPQQVRRVTTHVGRTFGNVMFELVKPEMRQDIELCIRIRE